jgi:hypothetical protein
MNAICNVLARVLLSALALACGAVNAGGLAERLQSLVDGPKPNFTMVLVDTTRSITAEDRQLYEQAMAVLTESARPGDRIAMAQVNDRPGSRFAAQVDRSFKQTGNSMHDTVYARRTRQALQEDFSQLRTTAGQDAKATLLIDAVGASGEWFAQARASGMTPRLLVLSDMVEESAAANFHRTAPTPEQAGRLIATLRQRKLLPDLQGVAVHVVGASGRDAAHKARIGEFWQAYFAATGATLRAYGRSAGALAP